jgi:hypothetical protein
MATLKRMIGNKEKREKYAMAAAVIDVSGLRVSLAACLNISPQTFVCFFI